MKKKFQVVYKGRYTNEIGISNFRNVMDFDEAIERIKTSHYVELVLTNIAVVHD